MIVKEVFLQAISALIGHRIRAVMTMTGIAWGIVAVVLLMAYGNGFHNAIMTGFRRAFSNGTVVVWNGQTSMQAGGERAGKRIRLKEGDVEAIRQLGLIKYASPEYVEYLPLVYGVKQTTSAVRGVAPEYAEMRAGMQAMIANLAQGKASDLAGALLELADAPNPPRQFIGGADAYVMIEASLKAQQEEMQQWRALSDRANTVALETMAG